MIKNKLGNFVKIKTGKLDANASSLDGEYPFFTCSKEPLKISTFSYDCKCVIVAGNGNLNVKYYEGKFDAYQRTYIIESKDESVLDTRYLYWFLFKYVEKLRELSIGGVIKYIKINNLTDPIIPIPSIEDQKRIVEILDKADALRQKRKQAIGLLDDYLKSVFLEMFGDPVKNPKGWEINKLGKLCDVRDGTHDSPKYQSEGFPLITSKNIKDNSIDFSEVNLISEKDFISINKRSLVDDGDILMPMIGTIGNPIIVKKDRDFAIKNVALIKFNTETVNNIYIKNLLAGYFLDNYISKKSRGGTQKFLSLSDIRNIEIPIPDIDVQNKFSKLVLETESLKQSMLAQSTELETQFQALMQKAFKGEL